MKRPLPTIAVALCFAALSLCACKTAGSLTAEQLGGEWNVTLLEGEAISPAENTPYIGFDGDRLYGSTGCNRIMGEANLDDMIAGKADFSQIATTTRACADAIHEQKFLQALSRVKKIVANGETGCKLLDSKGETVMQLTRRAEE